MAERYVWIQSADHLICPKMALQGTVGYAVDRATLHIIAETTGGILYASAIECDIQTRTLCGPRQERERGCLSGACKCVDFHVFTGLKRTDSCLLLAVAVILFPSYWKAFRPRIIA